MQIVQSKGISDDLMNCDGCLYTHCVTVEFIWKARGVCVGGGGLGHG